MRELIEQFKELKVAVVGDLILDKYTWGEVGRISPEAPVPVVRVQRKNDKLGGAGNTAQVINALGANLTLFGRLGDDRGGREFKQLLAEHGIDFQPLPNDDHHPTTVKTRVIAEGQHVVRIDEEIHSPIKESSLRKKQAELEENLENFDALLLSDYGKGVFSPATLPLWLSALQHLDLPTVVDPYTEHFPSYRDATILTPNEAEFRTGRRLRESDTTPLSELAEHGLADLNLEALLITRGEEGMTLFEAERSEFHLDTEAREVYDVTGAGDTVAGIVALGEALEADRREIVKLANIAAGLVVGRMGTAAVTVEELEEELD